ncbi:unnamed protein product [Protopolystoma xenopodis]|uniref:Uncharacterized protein n=1 Tax=Protopolystoma xenopodis TaxID=117903 RepID=A0A3S4ZWD8_9PLAT|nr:unnamed protein product [Protopolystoma xenopodis]
MSGEASSLKSTPVLIPYTGLACILPSSQYIRAICGKECGARSIQRGKNTRLECRGRHASAPALIAPFLPHHVQWATGVTLEGILN